MFGNICSETKNTWSEIINTYQHLFGNTCSEIINTPQHVRKHIFGNIWALTHGRTTTVNYFPTMRFRTTCWLVPTCVAEHAEHVLTNMCVRTYGSEHGLRNVTYVRTYVSGHGLMNVYYFQTCVSEPVFPTMCWWIRVSEHILISDESWWMLIISEHVFLNRCWWVLIIAEHMFNICFRPCVNECWSCEHAFPNICLVLMSVDECGLFPNMGVRTYVDEWWLFPTMCFEHGFPNMC